MSFPTWTKRGAGLGNHRGLAPLGLEPVGRRFVDELMPGVTGATWHIRYYSFFAWVLWTFHRQSETGAFPRTDARQAWWIGRMENVFRLASLYTNPAQTGIVGVEEARTIPLPEDPEAMVQVGRALRATAFVPAYYRSSFLALGCAEAEGTAVNLTLGTGVPLGEAFNQRVLQIPDSAEELRLLLAPTDAVPMRVIKTFAEAIRLRDIPTGDAENALLADLLLRIRKPRERRDYFEGDRARTRSLTLFFELLNQAEEPLDTWDFHAIFTSGHLPGGRQPVVPEYLEDTWTRWRRYQEREHERVALYALLYAVVPLIREQQRSLGAASTKTLIDGLWSAADSSVIVQTWLESPLSGWTVRQAQEAVLSKTDTTGVDEVYGLEALSLTVQDAADRGEIAGGAILLLLLVTGQWRQSRDHVPEWARQTHLRGGAGRISLEMLTSTIEARGSEPVSRLFDWLMETCVLGQAIRVAVEKLASRDYRFFLAMGDDGFEIVRPPPDSRFYYPPRTGPAFGLMSELGMLTYSDSGAVELTSHGETWLQEAKTVLQEEHGSSV
jgi:hypothetical protein